MQRISRSLKSGSTALLVLHLISAKDMYGYEIVKELEKRSQNVFSLKEGTLYPVLHELEKDGLIASYEKETIKKRKYYHITQKGTASLAQKKAEWKTFSQGINNVIGAYSYAE